MKYTVYAEHNVSFIQLRVTFFISFRNSAFFVSLQAVWSGLVWSGLAWRTIRLPLHQNRLYLPGTSTYSIIYTFFVGVVSLQHFAGVGVRVQPKKTASEAGDVGADG